LTPGERVQHSASFVSARQARVVADRFEKRRNQTYLFLAPVSNDEMGHLKNAIKWPFKSNFSNARGPVTDGPERGRALVLAEQMRGAVSLGRLSAGKETIVNER